MDKETIKSEIKEEILSELPAIMEAYINDQVQIRDQSRKFYQDNPDLTDHKDLVSKIANEVSSEYPDWRYSSIFEETARRTRERLGQVEVVQSGANSEISTPTSSLEENLQRILDENKD